jgi:prefoldin subunit 4
MATLEARVLDKRDESSERIIKEDQDRINLFARLNARLEQLRSDLGALKQEKENLEDASSELALAEDNVKFRIGEVFVEMSSTQAEEYLEQTTESNAAAFTRFEREKKEVEGRMSELKVQLYAKFGRSINLETDPDD